MLEESDLEASSQGAGLVQDGVRTVPRRQRQGFRV